MKVKDLSTIEGFETVLMKNEGADVLDVYTGDLLSDVIGNVVDDSVLVTVQAHKNTIAVGSLASIPAIVLCNGRSCPEDMVKAASENDISLFTTEDNQFHASLKIAKALNL
ncbi:MAG: iron-sulfur binding hydrogenase [Sphaerochaetaceae bacterium]|nr:iron-sulfur binding hydrogenase [Sphaerochaetaceae bacterium]